MREGARLWGVDGAGLRPPLRRATSASATTPTWRTPRPRRRRARRLVPGLSPVHALFAADRTKISPYSPSSRLFLETLLIDPTAVDGLRRAAARRGCSTTRARARGSARCARRALVDHAAVWELKRPLLEALWRGFPRAAATDAAFEAFRREGGEALEAHATFEALSEHFRAEGRWWLGDWPEAYPRRPLGARCAPFAQRACRAASPSTPGCNGSPTGSSARRPQRGPCGRHGLGLYRDLAVGADRGRLGDLGRTRSASRPASRSARRPIRSGRKGQNWGLPPFDPLTLERAGPRGLPRPRAGEHAPCRRDPHRPRLPAPAPVPDPDAARRRRRAPMSTTRSRRCWRCCGSKAIAPTASSSPRISARRRRVSPTPSWRRAS